MTIDEILETVRSSPEAASGKVVARGGLGVVEYETGEGSRGQFSAQPARYYLEAIVQRDGSFRSRVEGERGSLDAYLLYLENDFLSTYAGAASLGLAPADPLVGEGVRRCLAPDGGQI